MKYSKFKSAVEKAKKIIVIQAENPDGDSLGSALALEEVLGDLDKEVVLFCPVDIPKYMRYLEGWSRVTSEFDLSADMTIIVDTASEILLTKVLEDSTVRNFLNSKQTFVIDHHSDSEPDLKFEYELILESTVATGELLAQIFDECEWTIGREAAKCMLSAILSDTLGLTTPNITSSDVFRVVGRLVDLGASPAEIESSRRELMKKSPEILAYKAKLIERVEYYFDGKLAIIRIPWEEIRKYSDQYNPNVLIQEELRLVTGIEASVAIKTYPDGKLTGKIRSNKPIAATIAGYFGGGGHEYAAGFRIYEEYESVLPELIKVSSELLEND